MIRQIEDRAHRDARRENDEPAGDARREAFQSEQQHERGRADDERDRAGRAEVGDDVTELSECVAVGFLDAEDLGNLTDRHEDREPEHEAAHDRTGQELGDETELQEAGDHEEDAGQDHHSRG